MFPSHECDVLTQLGSLIGHREDLEDAIQSAVVHARDDHGVSWQVIGRIVGLTKQGAQKRYG